VDELLTLPDIILPGGGTAYPSGYLITWWMNCLPFRISYYLVDELLTLPEHRSSYPMFSGVRVAHSLV
jgi:hypothetical protein